MKDDALTREPLKPGARSFWIGFLVMLVFAGAGLIGSGWAIERILLEKMLYDGGLVTSGVVVRKTLVNSNTSARASEGTVYELTYRFESATGPIEGKSRVRAEKFFSVKPGDPLPVRYMADNPSRNLPDGSRLSGLFWFFALFGLLIGLSAAVVVIGMVMARLRRDNADSE